MALLKKLFAWAALALASVTAFGGAWSLYLILNYGPRIYSSQEQIPRTDAALVLGASVQPNKAPSPILTRRLNNAAKLYHGLKVNKLLLSGAHHDRYYNETAVMKKYLEKEKNIPSKQITLDPQGYRTLDSVYHSSKNYGYKSITIVTQRFHLYRALFLADHFEIEAFGFAPNLTEEVELSLLFREFLAQGLALFDAWILNTRPAI